MANAVVQLPVGYFPDPSKGRPLWNAKIYVGTIDLDPRTPANQKVVTGRQENGTEVALAQPIRTNSGGVPVDGAGNVVTLLIDGAYAMAVDDKNDNQKYYFANVLSGSPLTFEQVTTSDILNTALVTATGTTEARTLADREASTLTVLDDGVAESPVDSSEKMEVVMASGKTYNIPDGEYNFTQPISHSSNITQSPRSFIPDNTDLLPTEGHPDKGTVGIHKNWSRQFIGKTCLGNGKYDGTTTSNTGPGWAERDAQLAVSHSKGLIAIFGNAKSSDLPDYHASPSTMGVGGGIVNDKAGAFGWALYGDIRREAGAGGTFGLELAIKNRGDDVTRRAYTKSYGALGVWLAAGGDPSYQGAPLNPSNVAIAIGRNGHTWNRGIVFDSDGFTGSDGITGTATVIEMAKGHVLLWSTPANTNGYTFRSEVSDGDQSVNGIVRNKSSELTNNSGKVFWKASYETDSVNYVELNGTPTGVGTKIIAQGDDSNIDIRVQPKGAGNLDVRSDIKINNQVTWSSGAGSPEGVVSANIGSMYSRIDGGAGTSFYVKESGTGNTGWAAK